MGEEVSRRWRIELLANEAQFAKLALELSRHPGVPVHSRFSVSACVPCRWSGDLGVAKTEVVMELGDDLKSRYRSAEIARVQ
jgi:hypothetical protein